MNWTLVMTGFGASLGAGLLTGLGALPVLFTKKRSQALEDMLLGFAAGVMLAASFSLVRPGIGLARVILGVGDALAALVVLASLLLGGASLNLLNRYAPHEHFVSGREGPASDRIRGVWLFIVAITLHNLPEGLAVGFGGGNIALGTKLAIAIGLQNAPEGLSVAAALVSLGYSRARAVLIATGTGLVDAIGRLAGVTVFKPLLPIGLGFAAGAMLFVISNEIIPETHRSGHATLATAGLMSGIVVMIFLDTILT